jgi:hypothetical protein
MGLVKLAEGENSAAERFFKRSKEMRFATNAGASKLALIEFYLGNVELARGNCKQARAHFEQCLELHTQGGTQNTVDYAFCCQNMGVVYVECAELRKAKRFFLNAVRIFTKIEGSESANTEINQKNLEALDSTNRRKQTQRSTTYARRKPKIQRNIIDEAQEPPKPCKTL